jgi:hypothetical protein
MRQFGRISGTYACIHYKKIEREAELKIEEIKENVEMKEKIEPDPSFLNVNSDCFLSLIT